MVDVSAGSLEKHKTLSINYKPLKKEFHQFLELFE